MWNFVAINWPYDNKKHSILRWKNMIPRLVTNGRSKNAIISSSVSTKGVDRIGAKIILNNVVNNYVNCRHIYACEVVWYIMGYDIHYIYPPYRVYHFIWRANSPSHSRMKIMFDYGLHLIYYSIRLEHQ